jgi:hypothetical protein
MYVHWVQLAQGTAYWRGPVNTVINILFLNWFSDCQRLKDS